MENEIWRDIQNYEGRYQVSNLGNVKSLDRFSNFKNSKSLYKGKLLKQGKHSCNRTIDMSYRVVSLSKEGKGKMFYTHRLVAETFIDNPENKKDVNHINGIRHDNRLENLEWVTRLENVKHSLDVLKNKPGGVYSRKINIKEIENIKNMKNQGFLHKDIAKIYNVKNSTIDGIIQGKTYVKYLT